MNLNPLLQMPKNSNLNTATQFQAPISLEERQKLTNPLTLNTNNPSLNLKEPLSNFNNPQQQQSIDNQTNSQVQQTLPPSQPLTQTQTPPSQNPNSPQSQQPMKLLTKYKDIYVPTIFMLDYNDTSSPPISTFLTNFNSSNNNNNPQSTNSSSLNSICKDYFNYGYNFEQWKYYVTQIRSKFDELNDKIIAGKFRLPDPDDEMEYLMNFPSDYGGLGEVLNDQNFENVKFYDPKDTSKNPANKNFMSLIKFDPDQTWFPLDPNPSSLNNNISIDNKCITNSFVNSLFPFHQPFRVVYPNFCFRNPQNNTLINPFISNTVDNNNINNNIIGSVGNGSKEKDKNIKKENKDKNEKNVNDDEER